MHLSSYTCSVLISVEFQERGNTTVFRHNDVTIKYKLDNEFELVFTVSFIFSDIGLLLSLTFSTKRMKLKKEVFILQLFKIYGVHSKTWEEKWLYFLDNLKELRKMKTLLKLRMVFLSDLENEERGNVP